MTAKLPKELAAALHATGGNELEIVDPDTQRTYILVDRDTHRLAMEALAVSRIAMRLLRASQRWRRAKGCRSMRLASARARDFWLETNRDSASPFSRRRGVIVIAMRTGGPNITPSSRRCSGQTRCMISLKPWRISQTATACRRRGLGRRLHGKLRDSAMANV